MSINLYNPEAGESLFSPKKGALITKLFAQTVGKS